MRRRVAAVLLVAAGLVTMSMATLPPWVFGAWYHVPAQAVVVSRASDRPDDLRLTTRYFIDGRALEHDAHFGGPGLPTRTIATPSGARLLVNLQIGDTLEIWVDPKHPQGWHTRPDPRGGPDAGQWLAGVLLVAAGIGAAFAGLRRQPCAPPAR
jgi:hypothetical protein